MPLLNLLSRRLSSQLVENERKPLQRLGTRKVHFLIVDGLCEKGIKFERDKLFDLMRINGLLIQSRRRYTQTTMSKHWLRK